MLQLMKNYRTRPRMMRESVLRSSGIIDYIETYNLPDKWKIKEKIDHILTNDRRMCKTCNNIFAKPKSEWCSLTCRNKDPKLKIQAGLKISAKKEQASIKRKVTNMEKYGVEHALQHVKADQEKRTSTLVERYGENHGRYFYDIVAAKQPDGIHPIQKSSVMQSKAEFECIEILKSYGVKNIIHGERSLLNGREIDIYLPDFNLGIEHNGVYYHSDKYRDKHDMYNKMLEARKIGIRIINIWDYEWKLRQNQIMNFILPLVGKTEKIYGRKTRIIKIPKQSASEFISKNHIQPLVQSRIVDAQGIIYDDELVGLMTFSRHHREHNKVVLSRFCCKHGISILGGASKLLSKFDFDEVISWSDNRWSEGKVYSTLNFVNHLEMKPDYFYMDIAGKIIAKQAATKKKLRARYDQREIDRATELGYVRIWDCGKIQWKLTKS